MKYQIDMRNLVICVVRTIKFETLSRLPPPSRHRRYNIIVYFNIYSSANKRLSRDGGGDCVSPARFLPKRFMAVWYYYYRRYYYFFLFFFWPLNGPFLKYYDGGRVVKTYYYIHTSSSWTWWGREGIGIDAACFIPIIPFLWLRLFSNITACSRTGFLRVSV